MGRDPVGAYFAAREAVTGTPLEFELGALDARGAMTWQRVDHARHDALGALLAETEVRTRRRRPAESDPGRLPAKQVRLPTKLRELGARCAGLRPLLAAKPNGVLGKAASPFSAVAEVGRYLASRGDDRGGWPVELGAGPTELGSRASSVLSGPASARLRAEAAGIGMSAVLLVALHRAVQAIAPSEGGASSWAVPVDMRGEVTLADPTANHVVELPLALDLTTSAADVARDLGAQLERGLHRGAWRLAVLLERLGAPALRGIVRRDQRALRARPRGRPVFSNLGALEGDPSIVARVLFSPVTSSCPLAATALTWNGRTSLAIQLHPSLGATALRAPTILEAWLVRLGA